MEAFIGRPILPKLAERLKIRQGAAQTLEFSPVIVPIVNVDPILAQSKGQTITGAATTRTDTYTVPIGKQWHARRVNMSRANAGSAAVQIGIEGTLYYYYLTNTTVTEMNVDLFSLPLKGGDSIVVFSGTGTSGAITTTIIYDETDLQ